jgi:hypothetical protein
MIDLVTVKFVKISCEKQVKNLFGVPTATFL